MPARAFWRSGVADRAPFDHPDLYQPKFPITQETRILTAGSCFAQHVGRSLRGAGFDVIDEEPVPKEIPPQIAQRFGYNLYSARYGNIYTLRHFRQLIEEAADSLAPAEPVWERDGRYFDAQRPGVEPGGLAAPDHVVEMRALHLHAVASALTKTDVIVFTMGLTEGWVHRASGTIYPTAPGTIAGEHDPKQFELHRFTVNEILEDFRHVDSYLKQVNPDIRWVLSVSPVPLTATASDDHVLAATTYSKSILRVACGMLAEEFETVDYFPAYELITSPAAGGESYADNLRSPAPDAVDAVMRLFLAAHGVADVPNTAPSTPPVSLDVRDEDACEDVLLDAFRP